METAANWGPNLTFVNEASSTRSSPNPRRSQVVNLSFWMFQTGFGIVRASKYWINKKVQYSDQNCLFY